MAPLNLFIINATVSIILTISTMYLLTVDGCEVRKYDADPTASFCHKEVRKQNILQKLKLTQEPERVNSHKIPADHAIFKKFEEKFRYYQKSSSDTYFYVLFPSKVKKYKTDKLTATLTFNLHELPEVLDKKNVISALVAFRDTGYSRNRQYISNTLSDERRDPSKPDVTRGARVSATGWMQFNIIERLLRWNLQGNRLRNITVECTKECSGDELPISTNSTDYPYMMIRMKGPYIKLNDTCSFLEKPSEECSRKSVHLDFANLGWDKWMIFPKEYTYYYCRGSCSSGESCQAYKSSPQTFIYWRTHVLVADVVSDMNVKECECLTHNVS